MATKTKKTKDEEGSLFLESFKEFTSEKNISNVVLDDLLTEVLYSMIKRKYGTEEGFEVVVRSKDGDLEIIRSVHVVEDQYYEDGDEDLISISKAKILQDDIEVGEDYFQYYKFQDFGRRAILAARQTLIQRVKDLDKEEIYYRYKAMVGKLLNMEVYQIVSGGKEIVVQDEHKHELMLPKKHQMPRDRFKKGDMIKVVVDDVIKTNGMPRVVLSRTSAAFLERLLEQEVPEISEGIITIKKIVREPGERAKVLVQSHDDRVDPVGACVGMKGVRIHSVGREINNENIDIINYTENMELLVSRALSPAKVISMSIDPPIVTPRRIIDRDGIERDELPHIAVFMKPDQVSLAIGKGGYNIKLAGKLLNYEIDVYREGEEYEQEEDIELAEFSDVIEDWVIEEFKRIGVETARSAIRMGKEILVKQLDLEEEHIEEILQILQEEFED
jgi:transcription termination/antitermination protein NusA